MQGRRATTLIELLVAIVVILILVGLLLPALGAARASARIAQCSANQRNISHATLAFAAANRGYLPGSGFTSGTGVGQQIPTKDSTYTAPDSTLISLKFLTNTKSFACPDAALLPSSIGSPWLYHYRSNVNFCLNDADPATSLPRWNALNIPTPLLPDVALYSVLNQALLNLLLLGQPNPHKITDAPADALLFADSANFRTDTLDAVTLQHFPLLPPSLLRPNTDAHFVTTLHGPANHATASFNNPLANHATKTVATFTDGHTETLTPTPQNTGTTTYNYLPSPGFNLGG